MSIITFDFIGKLMQRGKIVIVQIVKEVSTGTKLYFILE